MALVQELLFDEMSGHDSQIETILVDPVAETVTVSFLSYPTDQCRDRIPLKILFTKVTSVSTIADIKELAKNRGFGNVVQWHISKKEGTSFISLTGGYLAITSRDVPTVMDGPEMSASE
ncbi:hypothetical protein C1T17_10980 [Sphingobium sp. SCG-1]|uniref:hypothetical protein n=1 Tax=Sphingobium sp. SCG-1 TaxID=2072936 RepID=UPI000CD67FEE|nr:hypothetical protein [Sphingobium sp. SCG-1]AUW58544.1 hypothetical protein C1T17_10980 [Sphingobium sp. SCG-1]